ncbi:hypothetical protein COU54_03545 [Candidatus Pacearchaeota archaeon CG10_big_fil_rev_8_21_14_0_10_31_24]|nr:MAG: hypothetical protein COU54_03545 [Candidatus Pacearchaeota archaeon CG10_big_fil_rev_8_21_14_0_10_31_24]
MVKANQNKIFLSLLLVGFLCVLVLPNLAWGADESVVDVNNDLPVIETVIPVTIEAPVPVEEVSTVTTLVVSTTLDPIVEIVSEATSSLIQVETNPLDLVATSTEISNSIDNPNPVVAKLAPATASPAMVLESQSFSTAVSASIVVSDEITSTTMTETNSCSSDCTNSQIAISNEIGTISNNVDQVSQIAISNEIGTISNNVDQVSEIVISGEYSAQTIVRGGQIALSSEISVSTLTNGGCTSNCGPTTVVVSAEYSFRTSTGTNTNNIAISDEYSFRTSTGTNTNNIAISAENSFTTSGGGNTTNIAISDEMSFTTLGGGSTTTIAISDEMSFTTLGGGSTTTIAISDEMSFTTLGGGSTTTIAISDEQSFTTSSNPSGCTVNCGGGGGGGGGGIVPPLIIDRSCSIYLKEYIKFGEANDVYEVKKLQSFLIVFEKETNLRVTGFYDRATFEAVQRFQIKYSRDVLGPWGITDSTGYVFITTRLAINNVYCGRDTENDLDLRNYYGQIEQLLNPPADIFFGPVASTTVATTSLATSTATATVSLTSPLNLLALAWVGALNFISGIPCWWWIILLLLIIILLLAIIWTMSRGNDDDDDLNDNNETEILTVVDGASVLPMSSTINEEKEYDTLPVTDEIESKTGE